MKRRRCARINTTMCRAPGRTRSMRTRACPASSANLPIRVTIGQLVEVLASMTADLADLPEALDMVLRTCDAKPLGRPGAVRIAWP